MSLNARNSVSPSVAAVTVKAFAALALLLIPFGQPASAQSLVLLNNATVSGVYDALVVGYDPYNAPYNASPTV